VSIIGKNTLRIVVDNANPIFNLQPTAINVDVDTPITTTVYDAQATNLNGGNSDEGITYSIKGTNADKISITTDTGILTYKTIQTSGVSTVVGCESNIGSVVSMTIGEVFLLTFETSSVRLI
jgi:hypothetical protein